MMREQLLKQKRLLTERLEQQDNVLTATEERRLIEIDEAIEAIDLAIDYQTNIINKRERDVQQSMRASQVQIFIEINKMKSKIFLLPYSYRRFIGKAFLTIVNYCEKFMKSGFCFIQLIFENFMLINIFFWGKRKLVE